MALALFVIMASAGVSRAESPRMHYMLHCMGCHMGDGSGISGSVPSLVDSMGRFLHVPGGREFLVRVPGVAQSSLTDGEVAELLNWMLKTFSANQVPRDFVPFSAEEIGSWRRRILVDVARARSELVGVMEGQ